MLHQTQTQTQTHTHTHLKLVTKFIARYTHLSKPSSGIFMKIVKGTLSGANAFCALCRIIVESLPIE
jgi:hypothetical protein